MSPALHFGVASYSAEHRRMLADSHYLALPPPGALFCVEVRAAERGLLGIEIGAGPLLGVLLVGRPVARCLPQDGTTGEVTRLVLVDGLPHGTASARLRFGAQVARLRGMRALIAYHDRTRHSGCIYRKSGFRRDGTTGGKRGGWGNRPGRERSAREIQTPKRRWLLSLVAP